MGLDGLEVRRLIESVEPMLEAEPQLVVEDSGDLLVVGDTHGDLESTLKALRYAEAEGLGLLFLGDYVDRGPRQVENIVTLLEAKLSWRRSLILLRGNHETVEMNRWYGFMETVYASLGPEIYDKFARLFSKMPYAALVRGRVLALHGGIAEGLERVEEIGELPKGELDPRGTVALQILWNDPSEDVEWFAPSWRGGGARLYGWKAFQHFMDSNGLETLIRAHEPQPEGYGEMFNGRLKSVFSCRFYGVVPSAVRLAEAEVEAVVPLE